MTRLTVPFVLCLVTAACGGKKEAAQPVEPTEPVAAEPAEPTPARPTEEQCRAAADHVFELLKKEVPPERAAELDAEKDAQIAEGVQNCMELLTPDITDCMTAAATIADAQKCAQPAPAPEATEESPKAEPE